MMTRRSFLWSLPLLSPTAGWAAAGAKPLRFGVIADCQYADIPDGPVRHYRQSLAKLTEAVTHLNHQKLDFVVNLGDSIDQSFPSFEAVMPLFSRLKAPCHHLAGNHDFSVATDLKKLVLPRLGLETGYTSWRAQGWRFISLDGNDISTFAHGPDHPNHLAALEILKTSQPAPAAYNGAVGPEQLTWLRGELAAARKAEERVLLFCHYPVFPANSHNLWNANVLLKIIAEHRDIVAAWMNGHNHVGNYGTQDGVHFLNFKGMVDTVENTWATVELHPDRIEVVGHGRESARHLPHPAVS
jgi:manganese-dependent ADP-ribose/CDP-alcohol diphosphatase